MKQTTTFLIALALLIAAPVNALAAGGPPTKIPSDSLFLGKSGSTASKSYIFDFGSGASNPSLSVDNATKALAYNKNIFGVGDGLSSVKSIVANVGSGSSNPVIRYNPATSSWEFSTDGVNFSAFGTGSGGAAVEMLVNQGFESGVTLGWANTGGTFAAVTSGSNLLVGKGSAAFTASATGQFFQSTLQTLPNGLVSGNCSAAIMYKGGDGSQSFEVVDGGGVIKAGPIVLASTTVAKTVPLTFPCPSSGSLRIKIISSSSGALYAYDQAHLGSVDLNQISQAQWIGNVTYSGGVSSTVSSTSPTDMTQTGATVTSSGSLTPATGSLIGFNIASMGPGVYKVVMNLGAICDVSTQDQCLLGASSITGAFSNNKALLGVGAAALVGTMAETFVDSINVTSSTGAKTFRLVGNEVSSATNQLFLDLINVPATFDVYYYPSQAQAAVTIANSALNWSGYTTQSGTWTTASSTYADPTGGSSVVLTQTTNTNFGTVSTMASSGMGITFTPQVTGTYHISARPYIGSASAAEICARLVDGTGTIIDPGNCNAVAGQAPQFGVNLSGDYAVTSSGSPVTIKIQLATTTGNVVSVASGVTGSPVIQWVISNANQPSSAPVLVGGVTTQSAGVQNIVSVLFAGNSAGTSVCSSDPCTIISQSGGVTAVNWQAGANYTVHFAAGTFSAPPICTATSLDIVNAISASSDGPQNSSTQFLVTTWDSGGSQANDGAAVICIGPK